jgi:uncharacterized protein (TIGR03437 family)
VPIKTYLSILPLTIVSATICAAQYTISTIAGGAPPPTPVPAVNASIGGPSSVTLDSSGNVYFSSLNCIFKIDSTGTLTRIAGNARAGYSGDGSPAVSLQLSAATGLAFDAAGNLFFADSSNQRIRKLSPSGALSTVAGNGGLEFISYGSIGDGGPASNAGFYYPGAVVVDAAGDVLIADTSNNEVRKVSPNGTITALAGTGASGYTGDGGPATSARLAGPSGLALDAAGNLYIADNSNNRIRKVSPSGMITTVAGNGILGYSGDGGAATSAELAYPNAVAVDSSGNLFIADSGNFVVRKVTAAGVISTVAGGASGPALGDGGPATSAYLQSPYAVAVDNAGNLYIADINAALIRKVSPSGIISTFAGNGYFNFSGDNGPATTAQTSPIYSPVMDAAGNIYFIDPPRIRKISTSGTITSVAGNGQYGSSGDGGPATSAELSMPSGLALDSAGNLYIADPGSTSIRKVSPAGGITTLARLANPGGFSGPYGIAVDSASNLYVTLNPQSAIVKISPAGLQTTILGNPNVNKSGLSGDGGPASAALMSRPFGIAVDGSGNLFVADQNNSRIRKISSSGVITTVAGNDQFSTPGSYGGDGGPATSAQLNFPTGVVVDGAGSLFIADYRNNRIRKVAPNGIITTIAGGFFPFAYQGDGGPGTSAALNSPNGVLLDPSGNVYFSDYGNGAIRKLTPAAPGNVPTVGAGGVTEGAGYQAVVSPGGIASLFGTNLAATAAGASSIPLHGLLDNVAVVITQYVEPYFGSTFLSGLFYLSPGQINFQVPWELAASTPTQIVVISPAGTSSQQTVTAKAVSPGIFSIDSSGQGQGTVTNANTGVPAAPGTPIARGQYITIYCSGLGAVSNTPLDGAAAVSASLSSTSSNPTVTIGGQAATVSFSGLAPGFVGLYQVNALVPQSVTPGSAVSLTLSIGGVNSNTVTIAVQ